MTSSKPHSLHPEDGGKVSQQRLGVFLFTTMSRLDLGPTQPIQWVPGVLFLGKKRPGHEADYSPPSSVEIKNAWSYTSTPPIRLLHGMVPSLKKGTRTTLLYLIVH
jgi:hypothetical protein